MIAVALALSLLAQTDEPAPAEAPPADAPASEAPKPAEAPRVAPAPAVKGADEAARLAQKWATMSEHDRGHALGDVKMKFGDAAVNAVLPPSDVAFEQWLALPEPEQIKLVARRFLAALIALDEKSALKVAGVPFYVEDRRVNSPDELANELGKALRSKRVDLWVNYDISPMSPGDMEKKFGRPPARLASWPWRGPKTSLAVANLSGHAAVLLLRQAGATWQVIGFHD